MVKDFMFGGNVNILQLEHVNIGVFHIVCAIESFLLWRGVILTLVFYHQRYQGREHPADRARTGETC